MLTKEEKLYHALVGLKTVLDSLGCAVENKIKLNDGTIEKIDCYKEIEKCIVKCINNTQPYKFEELHEAN